MAYYTEKEKYLTMVNGKEIKFNRVWNGHRFTDDECEKLAAGEMIQFTVRDTRKYGYIVDVSGKLEEQTYQGHDFLGFKALKYSNTRSDEQELRTHLNFPANISIDALKANLTEQIEKIYLSSTFYVSAYKVEEFDGYEFWVIRLSKSQSFSYDRSSLSVLAVVQDDKLIQYLEDSYGWDRTILNSQFGKRYAQLKTERQEKREREEKEKKEQAERDRIAEIRAREWKEIRLADYDGYADREAVKAWLDENIEDFDPSSVLFKLKVYTYWRNPSHSTIQDQSQTKYYVVPMIKNFPKNLIVEYFAYPIASSYIRDASDYDKTIEPDVMYTIDHTLHGTD